MARKSMDFKMIESHYPFLPEDLRKSIANFHITGDKCNGMDLLREIEAYIKKTYEHDRILRRDSWSYNNQQSLGAIKVLLEQRKQLLSKMFTQSQETVCIFKRINDNLLDLHDRMVDKMAKLYSCWLEDGEEGWQNDCNVFGRIFVDFTTDEESDGKEDSDFRFVMDRIADVGGHVILTKTFSGAPNIKCDRSRLGLEQDSPMINFSLIGKVPFGDFLMCRAFRLLYMDSLYAPQDILRMKCYWCDASITHQRIVNEKGELL